MKITDSIVVNDPYWRSLSNEDRDRIRRHFDSIIGGYPFRNVRELHVEGDRVRLVEYCLSGGRLHRRTSCPGLPKNALDVDLDSPCVVERYV